VIETGNDLGYSGHHKSCTVDKSTTVQVDTLILRKEVIQPHLPIRLPCYDFVPLTPHTFDGSFPYGLGHRLRVQTIQVA
jgi:hypothetical protein